ncbi:MAG: beta-ketoacyl synthase N-terminal-like domain-containing protein [Myxococcota bacterium]
MTWSIAIVGRGCALPGARTPEDLGTLSRAGATVIGPTPPGRWGLPLETVLRPPTASGPDTTWSNVGGYVDAVALPADIDRAALSATLRWDDLDGLDALHRTLIHAAHQALVEAGLSGGGPRIDAVIGNLSFPSASMARYCEGTWLGGAPLHRPPGAPHARFMSGLPVVAMARALRLGGTAYALDAACASSLVAIADACETLRRGRADVVLAGAVNGADDLFLHVGFRALEALSPTGRSRPFHAHADGLVPAEGAAVVALMRTQDAEDQGRPIHAVIRGAGRSNDGRARGMLIPSSRGQVAAIRAAYRAANRDPADLGWIECHATGTVVGDATEIESLARAVEAPKPIPIGSLKANLGHTITAAGAAGLIRVLDALHSETLPPTPGLDVPSPAVAASSFVPLRDPVPWPMTDRPRLAGISAFGFGGNNAHVVLEEYRPETVMAAVPAVPHPREGSDTEDEDVVVVGLGVRVGPWLNAAGFRDALFDPSAAPPDGHDAERVRWPIAGSAFPPRDLEQTLPQQLFLLEVVREALAAGGVLTAFEAERIGVFVGMGCDPAVARHGARWRMAGWGRRAGASEAWIDRARDACAPLLGAAGVVGCMPNICANRINRQWDLRGASATFSAEELSGVVALERAREALVSGALDAAIVAAVDIAADPTHRAAAHAMGRDGTPVDGAVAFVVARGDGARAHGLSRMAHLGGDHRGAWHLDGEALHARFGRPHAASGLLHVAAAVVSCIEARPLPEFGDDDALRGAPDSRRPVAVRTVALGGEEASVVVRPLEGPPATLPSVAAPLAPDPTPARSVGEVAVPTHLPSPSLPPLTPAPMPPPPAPHLGAGSVPSPPTSSGAVAAPLRPSGTTRSGGYAPPLTAPARTADPGRPLPSDTRLDPTPGRTDLPGASGGGLPDHLSPSVAAVLRHRTRTLVDHQRYLARQAAAMRDHRSHLRHQWTVFFGGPASGGMSPPGAPPEQSAFPQPSLPLQPSSPPQPSPAPGSSPRPSPPSSVATPQETPSPPLPSPAAAAPPSPSSHRATSRGGRAPRGPTFDRAALEIHARGAISTIFGPAFAAQDKHELQVRMPRGRLLLADRVTGIDAEPGVLGTGTVWTETDVDAHRWFLHAGRMPAGLMIEAGQADLFLISYMGIDGFNRGARAYRLLGCEVTYRRSLPRAHETLAYEITVDGHAEQDDTRLFFFHYDCHIDGDVVLSVRHGQAGFFSDAELAGSDGVIWSPETQEIRADAPVDPPGVDEIATDYDGGAIAAFAAGDVVGCFGPAYTAAQSHVATPTIQGGDMSFIDRVSGLDPRGGPWGRGYMRALKRIRPDLWFFDGHFENDPCMPGTLMLEGCLQMMAFYLAAMGVTLDRDGWRFEPVLDHPVVVRCRGQVLPHDAELHCEVFVEEFVAGPVPTLYADLLGTVNGLKAFHARRMGLRLVPDVPMSQNGPSPPRGVREAGPKALVVDTASPDHRIASVDGTRFDYASLLACAWGKPSQAFGPMYAPFDDGHRRVPRLPGPPYHFMSRVEDVVGPLGGMEEGSHATIAYDVPPDAWYFDETGGVMPFAVLLEVVLQPCGWLASYVGSAARSPVDLSFRNLDGDGVVHRTVTPEVGTLTTHTRLTRISATGGMIIQSFSLTCRAGDDVVFTLDTVFGFFPAEALAQQVGLPVDAARRAALAATVSSPAERITRGDRLHLLDRILRLDPAGGDAGRGYIVAEKSVAPGAWFFRAHFYQDPVQPGSLGLEALLQLVVVFLRRTEPRAEGADFTPIQIDAPTRWKYRGQVLPTADRIVAEATIRERTEAPDGGVVTVRAEASLWVDDKRIYEADFGVVMMMTPPPRTADR